MSMPPPGAPPAISAEKARLMRVATYASVSVALVLILLKIAAWLASDSVAVLASLIDSLLDGVASLLTLYAVRQALHPADREHRFGHGKAEPLAGLGQAAFIAGSSTLLVFEAGRRLFRPQPIENGEFAVAIMIVSLGATILLVTFQRLVVRRTRSIAIKGDSVHYTGDILSNLAVIIGLVVVALFGWPLVDPLLGIAIAGYLYVSAYKVAAGALDMLMDHELPEEERARIREIALAHPDVSDLHELRTRASGPMRFIQLHLEMDGRMDLMRAHAVSDEVEARIRAAFPDAEVLIHQDPAGLIEPHPRLTA